MIVLVSAILLQASAASAAVSWLNLPLACLPERAQKWQGADSEDDSGQKPCHCPPTSMCPQTYEQFSNPDKSPIPSSFVKMCCPVIVDPNPTCPDGSPVPPDGNCNVSPDCKTKYYPTLAESGLPGFEVVAWQGLVGPAGLPRPIVNQLAAQVEKLVGDPDASEKFKTAALEPLPGSTPDSFAAYVKSEIARWGDIVKASGAVQD